MACSATYSKECGVELVRSAGMEIPDKREKTITALFWTSVQYRLCSCGAKLRLEMCGLVCSTSCFPLVRLNRTSWRLGPA
jgi:hypothetical protein